MWGLCVCCVLAGVWGLLRSFDVWWSVVNPGCSLLGGQASRTTHIALCVHAHTWASLTPARRCCTRPWCGVGLGNWMPGINQQPAALWALLIHQYPVGKCSAVELRPTRRRCLILSLMLTGPWPFVLHTPHIHQPHLCQANNLEAVCVLGNLGSHFVFFFTSVFVHIIMYNHNIPTSCYWHVLQGVWANLLLRLLLKVTPRGLEYFLQIMPSVSVSQSKYLKICQAMPQK